MPPTVPINHYDGPRTVSYTHLDVYKRQAKALNMLRYYKGQHIIYLNEEVLQRYEKLNNKKRKSIDPEKLIWKPPVFTASQLRFAW